MSKPKVCPSCRKKPDRQYMASPIGGKPVQRFMCSRCGIKSMPAAEGEKAVANWNETVDHIKSTKKPDSEEEPHEEP